MAEASLEEEERVEERQFAGLLQTHSALFFRLSNTLLGARKQEWTKKHYFQLLNEAEPLESFLDDYGARYNRTYAFFTELVASLRGFSQAGATLAHFLARMDSYGTRASMSPEELDEGRVAVEKARHFVRSSIAVMLTEASEEARRLGLELTPAVFPDDSFLGSPARRLLPRDVGQADLEDEEQRIAEVATKYLQACEMLNAIGIRTIADAEERRRFLSKACTEEQARVYEATVHNLQSTYDTHVQNTVLEGKDKRLPRLRGHASAALHLLEAVTHLTHFIERHEDEIRSEEAKRRISELVDRHEVQDVCLNSLLYWADRHLQTGCATAEDLLPEYTNVQELEIELPRDLQLHARPAALIVKIVNHHGTPVQMVIGNHRCNAGSILELLVGAGSHPDQRRLTFHGDERPLNDIRRLFENRLGEDGLDDLPEELGYLSQH